MHDTSRRVLSTLLPCLCLHQVLDPRGGYAAAAARLQQVLQYRAYVRSPMQLAADEFEAALLREGLVQVPPAAATAVPHAVAAAVAAAT
jgi:hypothetical protein